ncbi:MAG: hypothetical protein Q8L73_03795 [Methylotenera sp.]|nr:hypothetical protein [Methylotenera sp.]
MNKLLAALFASAFALTLGTSAFAADAVKTEVSGMTKEKTTVHAVKKTHQKTTDHKVASPATVAK